MEQKPYLHTFISKLSQTIERSQGQWKDKRFASVNESDSQGQDDDDFSQYQQFMQKYRGKNGNIKPLGLLIYRKFIWGLIKLCLVLTLISLPVVLIYSTGGGIAQFQNNASFSKSLLLFSIANLPHYRFDNLSEEDLNSIQLRRDITIVVDIIGMGFVIGFLLYWRITATRMANSYVAKSPSPHLYCIQVHNIFGRTQKQLRNHFQKFGKLSQISCIYNNKNLLIQLTKLVKLVNKYNNLIQSNKNDPTKQQQLLKRIQRNYQQTAMNYLKLPNKPSIKQCFICFQDIKTRNKVADLYKYGIMPQKLSFDQSVTVHHQLLEEQQQIQQHLQQQSTQTIFTTTNDDDKLIPKVTKCIYQPLTLNWQNFDIDKFSQILKITCQTILLVIMLFMILLALFLLNINSSHVKSQLIENNTNATEATTTSKSTLSYQQLLKNNPTNSNHQIIYTFCASLTYSTFKWQYYSLCSQYFSIERNRFVLMLIFSLLVAVINLLTNRILWALVAFRQYKTLAERNRFLIKSIFMFSLINSAILILFIREEHIGPILRKIVTLLFGFQDESMRVTVYSQFNRQWYMNIGNQLMMNYVVSLIVFPHFHIILHWVRKKIREYQAKKKGKPLIDPNFNYCTFYAMSLKALFFTMLYSCCMPVFYLLCLLALNVQLYVGKFLIKKFVKQPVFVDNNAIEVAVDMIPYSLLFHCFINIFFLNVDQIFPTENSYFNMRLSFLDRNLRRMQRGSVYLIVMILIGLFIWNRRRIYKILIKYWLGNDQSEVQCDLAMKFSQLKNNPAFLSSYKMRDNPKYKILYKAMVLFEGHMSKLCHKNNNNKQTATTHIMMNSHRSSCPSDQIIQHFQKTTNSEQSNQQNNLPSTAIRLKIKYQQLADRNLSEVYNKKKDQQQNDEKFTDNEKQDKIIEGQRNYQAAFQSAENFANYQDRESQINEKP